MEQEPLYTAEQLADVKAYHRPKYVLGAIDLVFAPVLLILMVRFVTRPLWNVSLRWGTAVEEWLAGSRARAFARVAGLLWRGPGWAAALFFGVLFFELQQLVDLPLDLWFGFVREHEFGLSTASIWVFIADLVKGKLFFATALATLVFGLFGLARRLRSWWWVLGVTASVLMLGATAIDPYRSRLYVEQTPLPEGELRDRVTRLMKDAGIDFKDVLVEHTASRTVRLQAYFAGTGPTRTIVLNDSLVSALTVDEALASVAHEAGHVNEARWPARLASALALVGFLFVVELIFRRSAAKGWFGIAERADVRTLPIVVLAFSTALTVANPVSGALSREREYEADRYGIALTRDPLAFKRMLMKAARTNKMDPDPPRWVVLNGMSHPPIGERIAAIQ